MYAAVVIIPCVSFINPSRTRVSESTSVTYCVLFAAYMHCCQDIVKVSPLAVMYTVTVKSETYIANMQHSAYLRNHASKLYQTFCGLLCLWWHFNVLCTSGLVHDIMLSHNGLCGVGDASKASVRLGRSLVFAFALFFSHRILCQCAVQNYRTVVRCEHVINGYDTKCCFNMRSKAGISQLSLLHGTKK